MSYLGKGARNSGLGRNYCLYSNWKIAFVASVIFTLTFGPRITTVAEESNRKVFTNLNIFDLADNDIVARVGRETISADDVKSRVKEFIKRNQFKVVNGKYIESHDVSNFAIVPAKNMRVNQEYSESDVCEIVGPKVLQQEVENKLIFDDAHKTLPEDSWEKVRESVYKQFETQELPNLLRLYDVQDQDALERKLDGCGDSLIRIRGRYSERMLAMGWMQEKIKYQGPQSEDKSTKKQRIKQEVEDYLSELRRNTTVWTIFDSKPDAESLQTESIQIFPKTYREDSIGNSKLPKIIP